jgi:hypothetical protein
VPSLRDNLRHIAVRADRGVLTVTVDGVRTLNAPISLPQKMIVGFTAPMARTPIGMRGEHRSQHDPIAGRAAGKGFSGVVAAPTTERFNSEK